MGDAMEKPLLTLIRLGRSISLEHVPAASGKEPTCALREEEGIAEIVELTAC